MLLRYLTSLNYKNQEINKYKVMYIEQLERIIISLWPQKTVLKVGDISITSYKEVSCYLIKYLGLAFASNQISNQIFIIRGKAAVGLTPIYGAVGGVRKQTHS